MKQVEVTVYTGQGAITYSVKAASDNFIEAFLSAIEKGIVSVETVDGATLIINPLNAAAIEVGKEEDIPPV